MKGIHRPIRIFCFLSGLAGLLLVPASCLKDLPDSFPEEAVWNPELAFPLGSESFGLNAESGFDTTLFELDTITNLPQWVSRVEVVMEKEFDFDMTTLDNQILDDLNRILFRINLHNGFPNEVLVQGYFLDDLSIPVDSLFAEGKVRIPPGRVRGSGERIDPSYIREDAVFDREEADALQEASHILFRTILQNPDVDTSLIPYYPDYLVEVDIGTMIDLTMEF